MEEYEYSFNVDNIQPYIDYCENNGYTQTSVSEQNRVVYENKNDRNKIARITTTQNGENTETLFDYKTITASQDALKISKETKPIIVTINNQKDILSKLENEGYFIVADNTRIRYIYTKDNVTFEIDDYTNPIMKVVAIEGEKSAVDKVYEEIKGKHPNLSLKNN